MKLSLRSVGVRFGALIALNDVALEVASGERRALIGPNGAGKTTLFNVVSGDLRPQRGSVYLDDREVTRHSVWRRARLGLGRTFQRSTLFPGLTVAENLSLAVRRRLGGDWRPWPSPSDRRVQAEVERRLAAAGLANVSRRRAGAIGHGEQRALEIELVLAAEPQLVLLDEPMAGLSGGERQVAVDRLRSLPSGVTLLIVEHDLDAVFALAGRITVLDHGVVIADGEPEAVRADPKVQEVYLGA